MVIRKGGFFIFDFNYYLALSQVKQMRFKLISYSSPRKSLVKGERFIRFEEEQEFVKVSDENSL